MLRIRFGKPIQSIVYLSKPFDVEFGLVEETGKVASISNNENVSISIKLVNGETLEPLSSNNSIQIIQNQPPSSSNQKSKKATSSSNNNHIVNFESKNYQIALKCSLSSIPHYCCALLLESHSITSKTIISVISNSFVVLKNSSESEQLLKTVKIDLLSEPLQRVSFPLLLNKSKAESVILLEKIGGFIDGFGHLTWDAAFLLANYLMFEFSFNQISSSEKKQRKVVEVGAGTALVGMVCSAFFGPKVKVILTDLEETLKLTVLNVMANKSLFSDHKSTIECAPLRWEMNPLIPDSIKNDGNEENDLILCSDCVYSDDLFEPLILTLAKLCSKNSVILLMARPRYGCDFDLFQQLLSKYFNVSIVSYVSKEMQKLSISSTILIAKKPTVPLLFKLTLL